MADKEALLRKAREKGCFQALKILIEGTEELLGEEWKPEVRKGGISYKLRKSNHVMVRYGGLDSSWCGLEADVHQGDNRFGDFFGVTEEEVIARLKKYLSDARDAYETGYENRKADWVPIGNEADAEQFLAFLRSLQDTRSEKSASGVMG
jgi:hypothetical protein